MPAISLTQFWSNFKGRFLGTSRKDSNGHGDIGLDNICPVFEQQQYQKNTILMGFTTIEINLVVTYLACYGRGNWLKT